MYQQRSMNYWSAESFLPMLDITAAAAAAAGSLIK
jgi:hypothetical protein